jgi:hypothetical protein
MSYFPVCLTQQYVSLNYRPPFVDILQQKYPTCHVQGVNLALREDKLAFPEQRQPRDELSLLLFRFRFG